MAQKIRAIVDRKEVMLSPVAFRIAEKHFGAIRATSNDLPRPEKPKELQLPVVEMTKEDELIEDFAVYGEPEKPKAKPRKKKTT